MGKQKFKVKGVARIFQRGGGSHCQSEGTHQTVVSFSPHIVGCLLKKRLTKWGGHRHPMSPYCSYAPVSWLPGGVKHNLCPACSILVRHPRTELGQIPRFKCDKNPLFCTNQFWQCVRYHRIPKLTVPPKIMAPQK